MSLSRCLISFFLILFFQSITYAQSKSRNLGDYPHYLWDTSCQWTFQDIANRQWKKHESKTPSFGWTRDCLWLRIDLSFQEKEKAIFEIKYPLLDHVDVFVLRNSVLLNQYLLGDKRQQQNDNSFINPSFLWEIEPGDYSIYLRVQSSSSLQVPISLYPEAEYFATKMRDFSGFLLYAGMLMIMVIYHLILSIGTKSKTYLSYVLFVLSFLILQVALNGIGQRYVWPEAINNLLIAPGAFMAIASMLVFSGRFLGLKQNFPAIYRVFTYATRASYLLFVLGFAVPYALTIRVLAVWAVICILLTIVSSTRILILHQKREAIFYLLAWAAFLIGGLIYLGKQFGILPYHFFTHSAFQIGNLIEITLLSFALADRYNQLQKAIVAIERQKTKAEEKLRLEMQTRVFLVSELAHRLNNPLNYVQTGILALGASLTSLDSKLKLLLKDCHDDPDAEHFMQSLQQDFQSLDGICDNMKKGISFSSLSIRELRNLSGVDGSSLVPMTLGEFKKGLHDRLLQGPEPIILQYNHSESEIDQQSCVLPSLLLYVLLERMLLITLPTDSRVAELRIKIEKEKNIGVLQLHLPPHPAELNFKPFQDWMKISGDFLTEHGLSFAFKLEEKGIVLTFPLWREIRAVV